jgi:hypothetical protein
MNFQRPFISDSNGHIPAQISLDCRQRHHHGIVTKSAMKKSMGDCSLSQLDIPASIESIAHSDFSRGWELKDVIFEVVVT